MDKILYVGKIETGNMLLKEYKGKVDMQMFYAMQSTKNDILNVIIDDKENFKGVIINIDEIEKAFNDLESIIEEVLESTDTNLCILCSGRVKDDSLVVKMLELGVQYLMIYPGISYNARVIDNILNDKSNIPKILGGQFAKSNSTQSKSPLKENTSTESKNSIETKTVAIGSCIPRMGATTLSIQLTKYFEKKKKRSCYIDSTDTDYMSDFLLVYENEGKLDEEHNKFTLDNIDFYYDFNNQLWEYIINQKYDYIIFDMGLISADNDKINNFINSDYHILCVGSKANEFKAMSILLEKLYYSKTYYAFYSVPKAQMPNISQACIQNEQAHGFIPYIDDEFVLQGNVENIFNDYFKIER